MFIDPLALRHYESLLTISKYFCLQTFVYLLLAGKSHNQSNVFTHIVKTNLSLKKPYACFRHKG